MTTDIPHGGPLVVTSQAVSDIAIITLSGELDMEGTDQVHGAVAAALATHPRVIECHMARVGFMGSAGLAALIETTKTVRAAGSDVVIVSPSDRVSVVIKATGTDEFLTIAP